MTSTETLILSENAAKRIGQVQAADNRPGAMLRLRVDSGGCSGFSYIFDFEDQQNADDLVFENNGKKLLIDPVSFDLVKGSIVDYVEEMIGSYFQVKNPQAKSSCGCGVSFSL